MDPIQRRLFAGMAVMILLLSGLLVWRETGKSLGSPLSLEADASFTPRPGNGRETARCPEQAPTVCIYVLGAVHHPGVYTAAEGSRLADVLALAGGALPEADLQRVNLAQRVRDEGMYFIPRTGEDFPAEAVQPAGNPDGKININTADQRILETLDGIGPARAQRIIEYRERHGGFSHIEELMNISGIGTGIFDGLKDKITVR